MSEDKLSQPRRVELGQTQDLAYCRELLALLRRVAADEAEKEALVARYDRRTAHLRDELLLLVGFALGLIIFLILWRLLGLSLVIALVLAVIGFLLADGILRELWLHDRLGWLSAVIGRGSRADLAKKREAIEADEAATRDSEQAYERVPEAYRTIKDVQLLIHYLERGEADSLSAALYFLKMDR